MRAINIGVFIAGIVVLMGIYTLLALGLNMRFGTTGLIDLGVVAFFAIGAYTYVILTAPSPNTTDAYMFGFHLPMIVGFIGSGLVSAIFAFLVGLPAIRLKGEYLAIATYAFAEVVRYLFTNETWLTNGVTGFIGLRQPFRELFESADSYQYFYALLIVVAVGFFWFLFSRLDRSPFGRTLKAIRENEDAALAAGKNIAKFKMWSFVLGAAVIGFAGSFYVWYTSLIVPSLFVSEVTWIAWIALTIGGTGNYKGMILGSAVIVGIQEATRFMQASAELAPIMAASRFIAMGLILVLIIRFKPKGILPERNAVD
ncbi:branched-chain amino acid ABC transporter permease [Desulfosporosinus metallidurans]|uniref:Branched-chain amino acid transport system permease protein LivM n=1 Tax=Desulfosporosinus metallidurans TaxID=1888891 RepID=A0A1Q8QZU1_9FIRM|nr:branched-chain amino acid ABC transporter permease [Desulfosporosinus metallidurans]OLN32660.1 Branched-chain amino acid transport system permease protein LivM [Desulfosporosinus metallidurans]